MFDSYCDIFEHISFKDPYGISSYDTSILYTNIPCKLSYYKSFAPTQDKLKEFKHSFRKLYKLFITNTIDIKEGFIIELHRFGKKSCYKVYAEPIIYSSHQELVLQPYN